MNNYAIKLQNGYYLGLMQLENCYLAFDAELEKAHLFNSVEEAEQFISDFQNDKIYIELKFLESDYLKIEAV